MTARLALLGLLILPATSARAQWFKAGNGGLYVTIASGTTPNSADCDEASEAGRIWFDGDADTNGSLLICTGSAWKDIDDDGGAGGGAPETAQYIVGAADGTLSAERVATDTASVDVDLGTAAQAKFHVLPGGVTLAGDVDGAGDALDLDEAAVETELEAVLDLDQMQGTIGDSQIAAGAVDGGNLGEIADGSVTADDLGTDSVSADELNATGVETELEAVLDIAGDVTGTGLGSVDLDETAVETELESVLDLDQLQGNLGVAHLNSGTNASSSTFWRGDGAWAAPTASVAVTQAEVDAGTDAVEDFTATITDAGVSASSKINVWLSGSTPTGKEADELQLDKLICTPTPGSGSFTVHCLALPGPVHGTFKLFYTVGS